MQTLQICLLDCWWIVFLRDVDGWMDGWMRERWNTVRSACSGRDVDWQREEQVVQFVVADQQRNVLPQQRSVQKQSRIAREK